MKAEKRLRQKSCPDPVFMLFEQKSWRKSDGEMGDEIKKMKNGFMKMVLPDGSTDVLIARAI